MGLVQVEHAQALPGVGVVLASGQLDHAQEGVLCLVIQLLLHVQPACSMHCQSGLPVCSLFRAGLHTARGSGPIASRQACKLRGRKTSQGCPWLETIYMADQRQESDTLYSVSAAGQQLGRMWLLDHDKHQKLNASWQ